VSEASIGSSNRRVETLVGIEAFRELASERAIVAELAGALKTPRHELPGRVAELVSSLKTAEKRIAAFETAALGGRVPEILETAATHAGVVLVAEELTGIRSADDLRWLVQSVRSRLGSEPSVVALGSNVEGRAVVIVGTNEAARGLGIRAGALVKSAAGVLGGGGGGKDDLAQGGGSDPAAMSAALRAVVDGLPG
jgi:alanyl-tRNA synthetase